jgi:hypothetical protein
MEALATYFDDLGSKLVFLFIIATRVMFDCFASPSCLQDLDYNYRIKSCRG